MARGRGVGRGGNARGGRGGGRGGRGEEKGSAHSTPGGRPGRGGSRGSHSSTPGGGRGDGFSPGPATPVPYSARGRGGRSSRGGRGGGRTSSFQASAAAAGLANKFVYVEQEDHGIWRVSVPHGQRFSKSFLAGVEIWAMQMMSAGGATLSQLHLSAVEPTTPQPTFLGGAYSAPPTVLGSASSASGWLAPPPPPGPSPLARVVAAAAGGGGAAEPGAVRGALPSLGALGLPTLDAPARALLGSAFTTTPPPPPPPPPARAPQYAQTAAPAPVADAYDMASFLRASVLGQGADAVSGQERTSAASPAPLAAVSTAAAPAAGNFYSVELDTPPDSGAHAASADPGRSSYASHSAPSPGGTAQGVLCAMHSEAHVDAAATSAATAASVAAAAAAAAVAAASVAAAAGTDKSASESSFEEGDDSGSGSWATESCSDSGNEDVHEAQEGQAPVRAGAPLENADGAYDNGDEEDDDEEGDSGSGSSDRESESDGEWQEGGSEYDDDDEDEEYAEGDGEDSNSSRSAYAAFDVDAPEAGDMDAQHHGEDVRSGRAARKAAARDRDRDRGGSRRAPALLQQQQQHGHPGFMTPQPPGRSSTGRMVSQTVSHDLSGGRLRISLRLERQSLTDVEAGQLAQWYEERVADKIELAKLWLFDNRIGDEGAAALSSLLRPGSLREVHLSHNFITMDGARALLTAVPIVRRAGVPPLWLRLEWNVIDDAQVAAVCQQLRQSRGLIVDVPQAVKARADQGHELHLQLQPNASAHVRLPWISSQKQAPAEANILRQVKDIYRTEAQASAAVASLLPLPPAPAALRALPSPSAAPLPPCSPASAALPSHSVNGAGAVASDASAYGGGGPLLLFPDTSALLLMLGAQQQASAVGAPPPPPPLALATLQKLALAGRFGRDLAPHEQTFVIIADSVMKQLDGLKSVADVRVAVREFMSKGLESMGPAGTDFVTILGGHEGEGLVVDVGDAGMAGSAGQHVHTKGQAVDIKIVEVALFFMKEVLSAQLQGSANGTTAAVSAAGLPVILLSNDNAQIQVARAHGLPAFRLTGAHDLARQVQQVGAAGQRLTSDVLRSLLAPAATLGLGTTAGRSLQSQFDGAIATLHALLASFNTAVGVLRDIELAAGASTSDATAPGAILDNIRTILQSSAGVSPIPMVASLESVARDVAPHLAEWESVVRTQLDPSRVLKWAAKGRT